MIVFFTECLFTCQSVGRIKDKTNFGGIFMCRYRKGHISFHNVIFASVVFREKTIILVSRVF